MPAVTVAIRVATLAPGSRRDRTQFSLRGKGFPMGKTPQIGMVGFCWLGLALAGCDTAPKDKYHADPTFGQQKEGTISRNPTGNPAVKDNTPVVDAGAVRNGGGSLPDNTATGAPGTRSTN